MYQPETITFVSEAGAPIVHAKRRTLVSSLVGLSKLEGHELDNYVFDLLVHSGIAANIKVIDLLTTEEPASPANPDPEHVVWEGQAFVDAAFARSEPIRFKTKDWKALALRLEYFGAHQRYQMGIKHVDARYPNGGKFIEVNWLHTEFPPPLKAGSPATRTWGAAYVCAAYYMFGLYLANAGAFWRINRTIRFERQTMSTEQQGTLVNAARRTAEALSALRASLHALNTAFLDLDTAHTEWLLQFYEVLPVGDTLSELDVDATGEQTDRLSTAWETLRSLLVALGVHDADLTFSNITLAPTREDFHRVTTQLRDWHNNTLIRTIP